MSAPWLTLLWAVPAVGAVAAAAVPRAARWIGYTATLGALGIGLGLAAGFDTAGGFQFAETHRWISSFGAGYRLALDGTGLVLVLLTVALVPILLLAGWRETAPQGTGRRAGAYVALTLAVEAGVLLSFVTTDVLLFYLVFEAMLIPLYFLIAGYGGTDSEPGRRSRAAVKFLLYNLIGGLIMLAAVVGLYAAKGTFDLRVLAGTIDPGAAQNLMFLGFLFAFAVKAPLWPLHTWLPGAAVQTTPPTAVLMMAIVDKVGTFGMLRYCLTLFPDASAKFAPWVAALAVIGIVYGAVLAIGQSDVMALIAYTSISHFGFIILGIFARTGDSQAGSVLYMVNHGVATAALFLVAGLLVARRGSRRIADFGGAWSRAPKLGAIFLIAGLATLSLPGLGPFVSELLVIVGTYPRWAVAAVVSVTALVLSAMYVLWTYQRMFTGPAPEAVMRTVDEAKPRELAFLVPLIVALFALGLFPAPVLDAINPSVAATSEAVR
ncbi:Proton-translocating NADH-quinone oxidoreductase, chain M OS=Tsukamurella paurometabola (strain ATCC 8368 / DSM / CCUG 35730 / CIP 100753 / JCM 10117 /KCTC 9821 / NBRC 16120 / NCIMB 702349 / NCTC 13040) OX=521096 GN=Tpau_3180 PE=3 SV=1 [Tsukamurella paurometabola]|uniref:Proton-translocating NADH-quinone oxidoreductase, chain M n=1 Tax=Tsukamurella paurometabola (strain ATCC 8368 / DSM 20162 / CCUG 35730 / CIP 100753 / JCM 10117 / KCTC 9821 / NBRC 16120 / NCIMB 702349 / NCTC 13040) TaxID=521096 RepID=D5UVI5_TSUPD|nr:NADH-quinone oxidoreductase subunit M [Tsukamurella paurometabola]ADG79767.1 proton-translocating NADH-quinone oxidoreductase, chain M [Tsukamurella paurometabola DSM 20162]SUP37126.1 NADH-quinone oxidoreductase subunit M [Tsukamurella paurometabola]